MASKKRPTAPFVTVTVYSTSPEEETFGAVTEVLRDVGTATGVITESAVDHGNGGGTSGVGDTPGISGEKTHVIGELFQVPRIGPAYCEYVYRRSDSDRHAIAVNMSAEELGIPVEYLNRDELISADRREKFSRTLLHRMSNISGVLYGSVDIEQPVPTPSELTSMPLPVDLYIANSLLTAEVVENLEYLYHKVNGTSTLWENGVFYTPFRSVRARDPRGRRNVVNLEKDVTPVIATAFDLWRRRTYG
ncbi:hypothetical protein [Nocardia alba]|uniref:Uncharacterized protein n=1 Tax=Nocardia alba TaxID=225051 RepID=A0A4V2PAN2_9NOCA|nr:hypothetical protein [Nocardia alba]TCJ94095.1 hypothetical protein DFR71_4685 [Nocardia alba]